MTVVATYQIACELRARLDTTPRWRRRRRQIIDSALRHACHVADLDVERSGGVVETPLYDLLADASRGR